jgi:hypothetical protein
MYIPDESLAAAYHYFSYNDLSNLCGRIFYNAGFKLGHLGLMYVFRDPENDSFMIDELLITDDFFKALDFVGYDSKRYRQGFDTIDDICKFASSSQYMSSAIFALENRNATARVRDKKRPTYTYFLKWIEQNPGIEFDWTNRVELRDEFLKKALATFPEFERRYVNALAKHRGHQTFKRKFNGSLIMKWTGLVGVNISKFNEYVKQTFESPDEFFAWVYISSESDIEYYVKSLFQYDKQLFM